MTLEEGKSPIETIFFFFFFLAPSLEAKPYLSWAWADIKPEFLDLKNQTAEFRTITATGRVRGKSQKEERLIQEAPNCLYKLCPNLPLTPEAHRQNEDSK